MKIIDQFDVSYYQYLNEESQLADEVPSLAEDNDALLHLYRLMVFVRTIDTKAIALQRTGKLGTYPSTRGQEAVLLGLGMRWKKMTCMFLITVTWVHLIQRGVKLSQILLIGVVTNAEMILVKK